MAFDFAFLKKPVVYVHFDRETFLSHHTLKEGYFDFYKHGFGPVCKDVNSAVDALIHIMENGCLLGNTYLDRVNSFFTYYDGNNSFRILTEILQLHTRSAQLNKLARFLIISSFFSLLYTTLNQLLHLFYRLNYSVLKSRKMD